MPLQILREEIGKVYADAVVELTEGGLNTLVSVTAEADDGRLPRPVVLRVRPPSPGGGEEIADRYIACLNAALERGCETVALPPIASGAADVPAREAVIRSLAAYLNDHELTVYLCLPDRTSCAPPALSADVREYLDRTLVGGAPTDSADEAAAPAPKKPNRPRRLFKAALDTALGRNAGQAAAMPSYAAEEPSDLRESLERRISRMDKSFSEMLFHLIDERGMTDVACYKRANVSRKTFSKIKCEPNYRPSKETAIAFAIALHLNLQETEAFLRTAGITLSHSVKSDVIIEYFISHGIYDLMQINEILFEFDQPTLGC